MGTDDVMLAAKHAVLLMAANKTATDALDRCDMNVFDALDAVRAAIEPRGEGVASGREAA